MKKTKTYIIGDPVIRERLKEKRVTAEQYIVCGLIAVAALGACFAVGYLWGLTCFYYG